MNSSRFQTALNHIPYKFWVLMTISLTAGLLSLLAMRGSVYIESTNKVDRDYPVYLTLMDTMSAKQPAFHKQMNGAFYFKKGSTELLIDLYDDGFFAWESLDSTAKYTKLFAAGRYAIDEQGRILFSQMREIGLPYNRSGHGVKIYHIAIEELPFSYSLAPDKSSLELKIPSKKEGINVSLSMFLNAISVNGESISLRYLGAPIKRPEEASRRNKALLMGTSR